MNLWEGLKVHGNYKIPCLPFDKANVNKTKE